MKTAPTPLYKSELRSITRLPLKSSSLVAQKAAAPKNGVEFRQGSDGTIRSSLATLYDVLRRRACVGNF